MYSSCVISILTYCDIIANLLGGWVLQKIEYYDRTPAGEEKIIYSERYNVLPLVSFCYTNEGLISYADGKKIHFTWELEDNFVKIYQNKDTTRIRKFKVLYSNNNLVLEDTVRKSSCERYFLARTNYSIDVLENVSSVEISESDKTSSMVWNPFPRINSIVVQGREVGSGKIQVVKFNMENLYHSSPCTQQMMFLKSEAIQTTFPCYIITYDKSGYIKRINYAGTIDW